MPVPSIMDIIKNKAGEFLGPPVIPEQPDSVYVATGTIERDTDEQQVLKMLEAEELPNEAIAGLMGNISVETGDTFDHDIEQKGAANPARGLFQMEEPMRQVYDKYLEDKQVEDSAQSQIDFMSDTLRGEYRAGVDHIGAGNVQKVRRAFESGDVEQATKAFSDYILRPGKPHTDRRVSKAIGVYETLEGNQRAKGIVEEFGIEEEETNPNIYTSPDPEPLNRGQEINNRGLTGLTPIEQTDLHRKQVSDWYKGLDTLDKAAVATAPIPVVGDAIGVVADVNSMRKNGFNWTDTGFAAAGVIPFVPPGAVRRAASKMTGPKGKAEVGDLKPKLLDRQLYELEELRLETDNLMSSFKEELMDELSLSDKEADGVMDYIHSRIRVERAPNEDTSTRILRMLDEDSVDSPPLEKVLNSIKRPIDREKLDDLIGEYREDFTIVRQNEVNLEDYLASNHSQYEIFEAQEKLFSSSDLDEPFYDEITGDINIPEGDVERIVQGILDDAKVRRLDSTDLAILKQNNALDRLPDKMPTDIAKYEDRRPTTEVVFHGTDKNFPEFKLDGIERMDSGWYGDGTYFTPNAKGAETYATWRTDSAISLSPEIEDQLADFSVDRLDEVADGKITMDKARSMIEKNRADVITKHGSGPNIRPARVSLKKPFVIKRIEVDEFGRERGFIEPQEAIRRTLKKEFGEIPTEEIKKFQTWSEAPDGITSYSNTFEQQVSKFLESKGYDGIVVSGSHPSTGANRSVWDVYDVEELVVFDPKNIQSIFKDAEIVDFPKK